MTYYMPYKEFKSCHSNVNMLPRISMDGIAHKFGHTSALGVLASINGKTEPGNQIINDISQTLNCKWTIWNGEMIIAKRSSWELARLIWM